jgi:arylsulfatase A
LLYNLNDDPSEKFNIANQYPEVIEKIKELIDDHNKNLNAPIDLLSNRTGVEF